MAMTTAHIYITIGALLLGDRRFLNCSYCTVKWFGALVSGSHVLEVGLLEDGRHDAKTTMRTTPETTRSCEII